MYKCLTKDSKNYKKYWLNLPSRLYKKNENPQDYKTEKQILEGTHPLSCDIEVYPYVLINSENKPVARCLLTYYHNDDNAYLGFFEAENNIAAMRELILKVKAKAIEDKKKQIIGPIDASIYINYRFKYNMFDKTYTGEPYNKSYYPTLWEKVGFQICDKYSSYQLRKVIDSDNDERFNRLISRFEKHGYEFVNMTPNTFDKILNDIYPLLMSRYSNFAAYKELTKEQFITMFSSLQKILNYDMVKVVYKDNILQAFCVCIPNYGNLTRGKLNISKIFRINAIKKDPEEYVVLYLAANEKAFGLGGALIQMIRNELYKNQCTSIAGLIHEGNTSEKYYNSLHTEKYEYVLYSQPLPR